MSSSGRRRPSRNFCDRVRQPLLEPLAAEARQEGAQLVIGMPVLDHEHQTYYNGLISLGKGEEDLYDKRHLVPFGEFMPFASWLGPLAKAFEVPMSDFSSGAAERPLLQVGPIAPGPPSVTRMPSPPRWSRPCRRRSLPDQRQQRRLVRRLAGAPSAPGDRPHARPGERPHLLRATNTGISAIIDRPGSGPRAGARLRARAASAPRSSPAPGSPPSPAWAMAWPSAWPGSCWGWP